MGEGFIKSVPTHDGSICCDAEKYSLAIDYMPKVIANFYPILLQHSNTILNFYGFKFVKVYSSNMKSKDIQKNTRCRHTHKKAGRGLSGDLRFWVSER